MIDGKPIPVDETASTVRAQADYDFSTLHGFQFVGARAFDGDEERRDEPWRVALKLELETRAARLHQAVDASIVLANDGAIRWLGGPVARLALGPDLLTPSAVILADDALPEAAREIVATRLGLWLAATMRRLLAPLFELQAMQDGSEAVRDLAAKIVRSLGVLDREPIRGQVRGLDQNARAALRKHGVRFGAYYIYIPTLLKPAARALALHLWNLQTPAASADALARDLAPLASSGRTSLPYDPLISRESYRVAGFRPCGDRIVRIDIVERLADMIRAAIVERPPDVDEGKKTRSASGFLVTGQMTSLTGCSGDQFASILKSLGFECVEIKRSELAGALSASPRRSAAIARASSKIIVEPEGLPDANSPPPPCEEALDQRGPTGPDIQDGGKPATLNVDRAVEDAHAGERSSEQPDAAPVALLPPNSASSEEKVTNLEETVAFWRPSPRPSNRVERRHRQNRRGPAENGRSAATAKGPDDRDGGGHPIRGLGDLIAGPRAEGALSLDGENRDCGASDLSAAPEWSKPKQADKKRRQTAANRDMSPGRLNSGVQQKATVDPNSPFAKLVELRSLLEAQSKNRP